MLTERAKRRIDAQQLCNFTALDKQTKQELMMSGRRRMYTSRHMAHGGRGGGGVPGSGVLARYACHNLMWGGRTWRRAGSPHSRRPVHANPMPPPGSYPHSALCTRPATWWTWTKTRSNRSCNRTADSRPRRCGPSGRSDAILCTTGIPFYVGVGFLTWVCRDGGKE